MFSPSEKFGFTMESTSDFLNVVTVTQSYLQCCQSHLNLKEFWRVILGNTASSTGMELETSLVTTVAARNSEIALQA